MPEERSPEFVEEEAYYDIVAAERTSAPVPRAYAMAVKHIQEDVAYMWDNMDSFEGFRTGLDELLDFRRGAAEGLIETRIGTEKWS